VQTIGILVAEKTDVSAKLTQSFKQLERKQSEMDELHGRLKASRERVQELEKEIQNSTSNVQKREMVFDILFVKNFLRFYVDFRQLKNLIKKMID
jgi:peptidoglycan hydrolase CwlO-like protein